MKNTDKKQFQENYIKINPKKRQLFLSKINIKQKPVLKKYLTQFFETPQKFFVSKFSNKEIILNKFKSPSEIYELPIPQQLLKYYKRRKSKADQELNDPSLKGQIKKMVSNYYRRRRQRKILKQNSETQKDKEDKKEISEQEIDDIFNTFEIVRKINKNKINNFVTKDKYMNLINNSKKDKEKEEKNETENNNINIIEEEKEINTNRNKKILMRNKSSFTNRNTQSVFKNRILSSKIAKFHEKFINNSKDNKNKELSIPKINNRNNKNNKNSSPFASVFDEVIPNKTLALKNDDYMFTINSQNSTLYKTRNNKTFRSKLKSALNNFKRVQSTGNLNNELLQKQFQYSLNLNNKNNQTFNHEFLKKLASQEKSLDNNTKYNYNISNLLKLMSKKIKKNKGDLMLGQLDDYRIQKDLKNKLENLMKTVCPENHYNWELNLRNGEKENIEEYKKIYLKNNTNKEIARNPYNISNRSKSGKMLGEYDEEYIKQNVPKFAYKKFIKDTFNAKGNLDGLSVEGKNLLKHEQSLIKKIKGKKMMINYDNIYKDKDINDTLFVYNLHINKFIKP